MAGRGRGQGDDDATPRPGERRWIHPSELPVDPLDAPPAEVREPRSRVALALTAGFAGALATFGVTVLVVGPSSSKVPTTTATTAVAAGFDLPAPVAAVTRLAAPGVVGVAAWAGSAVRYGSGLVYGGDGLVVTAASLVADAGSVEVRAVGGATSSATVVGIDPDYDLALLRTDLAGLTGLTFPEQQPDSAVGDGCVLLGAGEPNQEGYWAARASLAAVGKVVATEEGRWMVDVLEVDADLDATGVGGALLDSSGRLLGVLTDAGQEHVSGTLVVPAATARKSVEQLAAWGRVDHPWLGLATIDVADPVRGALVHAVDPEGPAAGAGLAAGDIVTHLGGREIRGRTGLLRQVRRQEVGDAVVLVIIREGERFEVTVTLGARP